MTGTYQAPLGGCTNGDSGTFSATAITSTLGCAPVPPGIVSWWRGEGNAQDQTGSNPGTLQGGVTFGSGKVGQAFSLRRFHGIRERHRLAVTGSHSHNR